MMAKMTIITKMTKIAMMIMIDDKDSMIDDKDSMFQDHGDLRGYVGDPGGGDSRTHAEGIQECTNCQAKSGQLRVLRYINAVLSVSDLELCLRMK